MGSGYGLGKQHSSWWFGTKVLPTNVERLIEIIVDEVGRIQKGYLRNEDIEAAKQYQMGKYQMGAQTAGGLANGYSGSYYFDETIDLYHRVPDRIEAVTKNQIVDVVRHLFEENIWGFGVLGGVDEVKAQEMRAMVEPLWNR